jgi:hypothetical protein
MIAALRAAETKTETLGRAKRKEIRYEKKSTSFSCG